jgi:4,5-dihydroxyphthalate decarboxylase
MSASLYIQLRMRGGFPFVAMPVFPSRMFRHGFIFTHSRAGVRGPADLAGRRIGVQEYHQTAAVWIRGILRHEYGADLSGVRWYEGGVNAPQQPSELDLRSREPLDIRFIGSGVTLNELLVRGDIDAYFGARKPAAFGRDPAVARLFADPRAAERAYYQKTRMFPIMHTLVLREPLYEHHPWVAESLYKAFVQAKHWCLEQMRFSGTSRYTLPWLHSDLEEIGELFGGDPWPYGLEANKAALHALAGFLAEQAFIDRIPALEELFVPLTVAGE